MNIKEIENFLKMNKIRPSQHRLKIYHYLMEKRNHPTVDRIYRELVEEIPTLSKTTVYNTLNLFVDAGIAQLITIDENETRYDADTSIHGHFQCRKCGEVYDFQVSFTALDMGELGDFQVEENHIYLKGICRNCQMLSPNK